MATHRPGTPNVHVAKKSPDDGGPLKRCPYGCMRTWCRVVGPGGYTIAYTPDRTTAETIAEVVPERATVECPS